MEHYGFYVIRRMSRWIRVDGIEDGSRREDVLRQWPPLCEGERTTWRGVEGLGKSGAAPHPGDTTERQVCRSAVARW